MSIIRVLIAEDHTIVRKGLRALLDESSNIEVIAEAADGHEAVEKAGDLRPDVVVMDISMPLLGGLEATRRIKERFPIIKVVILTMHSDEEYIFQSLRSGAEAYLVKETAPAELVSAIEAAYQGKSFLSPTNSKKVIEQYLRDAQSGREPNSYDRLTKREREVLQLIAEGHSSREIGAILYISEKTVRAHRKNLTEKLNLYSAAELTLYALRKGVITLDE
jgi:DNA-binding NarL/FixJ family response regulator